MTSPELNIPKKNLVAHFKKQEDVMLTQYGIERVILEPKQVEKTIKPPIGLNGMSEKQDRIRAVDYKIIYAIEKSIITIFLL